MPEYHLDVHDNFGAWRRLDAFTQGYIEAMFFTEHSPAYDFSDIEDDRAAWEEALSEGQSDGQIPGDASFADLSSEALARCIKDCAEFQEANEVALLQAYDAKDGYDAESAGRDFWYTRNGHGVGFWDRGLGEVGQALSDACGYGTAFSVLNAFLGDDNTVGLEG